MKASEEDNIIGKSQQVKEPVNSSDSQTDDLLQKVSAEMLAKQIDSVTLYFDDSDFIYFKRFNDKVKQVHGGNEEYNHLQRLLTAKEKEVESRAEDQNGLESLTTGELVEEGLTMDATLIHQSMFTPVSTLEEFFTQANIHFEPFEAPGGDFYWFKNYPHKTLIIVGDCTGHGMQGTMITMSILTLLKQHFRLLPDLLSKEISDLYTEIYNLREGSNNDLLDCELGLIIIDRRTLVAEYIGSGVNMVLRQGGKAEAFTSRKAKLLNGKQDVRNFQLTRGDEIYMFSDGIMDQFNDENTRKLGSKGMVELVNELPMKPKLEDFEKEFAAFRGHTPSLDDQTLLMLTI